MKVMIDTNVSRDVLQKRALAGIFEFVKNNSAGPARRLIRR